jgi:hypothetical protein
VIKALLMTLGVVDGWTPVFVLEKGRGAGSFGVGGLVCSQSFPPVRYSIGSNSSSYKEIVFCLSYHSQSFSVYFWVEISVCGLNFYPLNTTLYRVTTLV